MFDSSRYDIPTLIGKLHDQRFDGYDAETLAQEVEKFQAGGGTAGMSNAVDALKKVAGALSHTDTTLRDQLAALGVVWQSEAGGQASAVLSQQAGFSSDANTKVAQAAQLIFEQGEAFTRTKNKLPDPAALRQGDGGYSVADTLFSLFGFETDHAKNVKSSLEAKAQTVDALNAYAHDSGNYLASSEPVAEPQSMDLLEAPGYAVQSLGGPAPVTPAPPVRSVPDVSPTQAAGAKDAPVRTVPVVAAPPPAPIANTPTPPIGVPAAYTGSAVTAPQQATTPSSTAPAASSPTEPISGVTSGGKRAPAHQEAVRPVPGAAPVAPGEQLSGGGVVSGGGVAGGRSSSAWGKPSSGGAVEGVPGAADSALGKGKMFGSVPGSSASGTSVGPGFANVRAAGGVGGLAEGAPAIGAAGAGGAVGGEDERRGRGVGKNNAGKRVQQLPIGELPEEEEAQRAKNAGPQPPSRERTRAILEPAATQDGEEDAEHVRRYGIDDKDLFSDPRAVSPDLIGDNALPEDH
jgi:hypothetical protein